MSHTTKTSYARQKSGVPKKANADMVDFLNRNTPRKKDAPFSRMDSAFSRASGDLSSGRFNQTTSVRKGGNKAPPASDDDLYNMPDWLNTNKPKTHGGQRRPMMSAADKNDKIIEIERENNILKEKENFLTMEIKMMSTKLKRVESLIKRRGRTGEDDGQYDISDMQRDLESETEDLRYQNAEIREKVRKLTVVQRGLTKEMTTGPLHKSGLAKNDKYAHVQGKLEITHSKVTTRYQEEAKDIKAQIVQNQKKERQLERELQEEMASKSGILASGGADVKLRQEILDLAAQARDYENEIARMEGDFTRDQTIFSESKNFVAEIQADIRKIEIENAKLSSENFRLQHQTQQFNDIARELKDTIEDRDKIERAIQNVTAEPFLRKDEENSLPIRIQNLKEELRNLDREARTQKDRERQIVELYRKAEEESKKLHGEKLVIEGSHEAIQKDYQMRMENRRGPNEQDAVNGLLRMDATKYTTLMTDLAMGDVATGKPIWADLPFLEQLKENQNFSNDPKKNLKHEIDRLRQEKSDFAAELEKAQNLLRLQSDIQTENQIFYESEEKRLKLIEKSVSARVEELSRRADDKARSLTDLERKRSVDLRQSQPMRQSMQSDVDARSEFSAQTQESEVAMDENILDFKVEDAEFDPIAISAVSSVQLSADDIERQFITVVTVDFYNHSTETTQMSTGKFANYQTQFSFVNKVDNFYVNFLQKNSIKLDVYVSKNNAAIQLGRAEILLRELIEGEIISENNVTMKPAVIQKWATVYPVAFPAANQSGVMNQLMKPLGMIKFKMRLRKPIQQAYRYYREQNEISNVEAFVSRDTSGLGSIKAQKKLVTIQIVGAKNLKVLYQEVAPNISPFFFYQFYTFDDKYSANAVGQNPTFNDTMSYEVLCDSKAIKYFEKECLEVILFDDNAPIAGVAGEQDKEANDDMIGMAKVPLASLASGCSMHDTFPIRALGSNSVVGQLEVRIDIMNLESAQRENLFHKAASNLVFSKQFEQEIIMQIARKLAPLNCEIELMFGIFSQGQRTCDKVGFKHTCLQRLRLQRDGMQERELDMFLQSNDHLRDSDVIEKDDFVYVFKNAIIQARNERANQLAHEQSVQQQQQSIQHSVQHTISQDGHEEEQKADYVRLKEQEVFQALKDGIVMGGEAKVLEEAQTISNNNILAASSLKEILQRHGFIHAQDAHNVTEYIKRDNRVEIRTLRSIYDQAKVYLLSRSQAFAKFERALGSHGSTIIAKMEEADKNKDGLLIISGFEASLLYKYNDMNSSEVKETFYLICDERQEFAYYTWIGERFPNLRQFFTLPPRTPRTPRDTDIGASTSYVHHGESLIEPSVEISDGFNMAKYMSAKQKIEQYLLMQEVDQGMMFAIIDTNSDSEVTWPELREKLRALHIQLYDDELLAFFRKIDKNGSQTIDFGEFVEEFKAINTEQNIKKIKNILNKAEMDPESYFNNYCRNDRKKQSMSVKEFEDMVRSLLPKLIKKEMFHLVQHFDHGNKRTITKQDFLQVMTSEFSAQKTYDIGIEDVIKPLATKARKFQVNIGELFDKYDTNRNMKLSAEELRDALNRNHMTMNDEDLQMIKDYFIAWKRSDQINKNDFITLMNKTYSRQHDPGQAKKAIADIRLKVEQMEANFNLQNHMMSCNETRTEQIYLAGFKRAISKLKCLDQHSIDNLAKFMDEQDEGFISISSFCAKVNNANMGASFGKSNKWSK